MVKSKHRGASSVQLEQPEWLNYVGRLCNTLPFLLYYLSHGSETWLPMRILAVNIQHETGFILSENSYISLFKITP